MVEDFTQSVQQSSLTWFFSSLGWKYTLLLPMAGLFSFVVVLVLILRGKGPAMVGALVFLVPLPFFIGVFGVVDGLAASFQVIAMSDVAPKPSRLANAISMSLVSAWVGMFLSVPGYLLAVAGLIIRSFGVDSQGMHRAVSAKLVQ